MQIKTKTKYTKASEKKKESPINNPETMEQFQVTNQKEKSVVRLCCKTKNRIGGLKNKQHSDGLPINSVIALFKQRKGSAVSPT